MSHPLELLIVETVQLGGSLVFIADQNPATLSQWQQPLVQDFAGEIPFVTRTAEDLLAQKYVTRPEDLVLFQSNQKSVLTSVDAILNGQRVLLGAEASSAESHQWDYTFADLSLHKWQLILQALKAHWGQWSALQGLDGEHGAGCLFLDRDDVVVKNVPYNKDPEAVQLLPGICELINKAHAQSYWVALVTNQSGLGRGWISWSQYQSVHQRMMQLLAQQGAWIDDCEWSAFIDEAGSPRGRLLAGLRKPRNGMLLKVNSKLRVNMAKSVMVGDSASDLKAAFAAGVGRLYLLASEKTDKEVKSLQAHQAAYSNFKFTVLEKLSDLTL
ncbi:D-glycero-alpha-D-manno-heptose-1,7-bisphosphate 7-phosphatase [Bdellovibrio bacteriovorus]|uniref:D,D-heptose 1,7-bisphosphate phosphatase n=1 Tax=Bdellovibrio bacteriovorus str. Tiberius TaxID=1069642 RepID=K7YRR0_BDEBC|nr:HAD-IIIA family hydrolase [Bdellovibrio bacteriovorus]AFY02561.1 histidinol phosphatase [Bdellovibrio bacteriovorus str. Tiberius]